MSEGAAISVPAVSLSEGVPREQLWRTVSMIREQSWSDPWAKSQRCPNLQTPKHILMRNNLLNSAGSTHKEI
eukprot:669231-Amorphochlora_amoeboformis.AAC.1